MSSNKTNQYINYLNVVSTELSYYFLMIALPVGLIGNVVSFYIYTRPSFNRKNNTGFLYASLCIANLFSILQYDFLSESSILFDFSAYLPCGIVTYLQLTAFNFISLMQVYISFDRFISVLYSSKAVRVSKKRFMYGTMLSILVVVLIVNLTNVIAWPIPIISTTATSNQTQSQSTCYSSREINALNDLIEFSVRIFIPFASMLTFDSLVVAGLKRSRQRVAVFFARPRLRREMSSKDLKFTVSTLFMDLMFLIMHMPVGVALTMALVDAFTNSLSLDPLTNAVFKFYSNLAQLVAFSYSSAGFFMFVCFNRIFRKELLLLLRFKMTIQPSSTVSTISRAFQN